MESGGRVNQWSVLLVVVAAAAALMGHSAEAWKEPRKYTFYMHNTLRNFTNENFTNVITAAPDLGRQYNEFGMFTVFEDDLTANRSTSSRKLGVGRGVYLFDSQAVEVMFFMFTATIETTECNGTIDIIGQNPTRQPGKRYLSVVGGTGDFFLARGNAALQYLGSIFNPLTNQSTWTVLIELDLYYPNHY